MLKPKSVNILGKEYSITYVDKPSDVDIYKRDSLWGQIDYWTHSIRIYDNKTSEQEIWDTILHEVLHGLVAELKIKSLNDRKNDDQHDAIHLLAMGLTDVLFRNDWIKK